MSEPTLEDVMARMDDVLREVRRQGRAAIAAQAAAESCLEAIHALPASDAAHWEGDEGDEPDGDDDELEVDEEEIVAIRWLRTLIPILDAIDRVAAQAETAAAPRPRARRWRLRALFAKDEPVEDRRLIVLAEGLRILQDQLQGALGELGVAIERRPGAEVDPERHRVVEARPARPGERPGRIVEIVRPGYALGATVVREAEVVALRDE